MSNADRDPNAVMSHLRALDGGENRVARPGEPAGCCSTLNPQAHRPGENVRAPVGATDRPAPVPVAAIVPLAGRVALALLLAGGVVALTVHFLLAGEVRAGLGFRFPGVPATLGTAARILATNLRALAGVVAVLTVAQLLARWPVDEQIRLVRWLLALLELLVVIEVAVNVLVVGGAVGAYGTRMVRALLPHGPVELTGDALALALLLTGRRRPLAVGGMIGWAAVSVGLLIAATILETWVNL